MSKPNRLKFRAWDKTEKHFIYFELHNNQKVFTPDIYPHADLEDWSQSTGYVDKVGKEVFDGDIYRRTWNCGEGVQEGTYVIDLSLTGKEAVRQLEEIFCLSWGENEAGDKMTGVIGNIYENPELLSKND